MADEPTIGEVVRILADLRRSFDQLAGKVLTVEVWKAERESMEFRIRETEKDIANLDAEAKADRKQREQEKAAADIRAASARRQVLLAVVTSFVFPVLVAIVLAATLKG
jgi:hypothetical protein